MSLLDKIKLDKIKGVAEEAVEKAKDLGEEAVEKATDVAGDVVEKAKDVVDREKPPQAGGQAEPPDQH